MMEKINLLEAVRTERVEWKPLGEVASYIRGLTYSKGNESPDGVGYKVLRANNISLSTNTLNFDDVKVVKFDTKIKDAQKLYRNDVLISAASGSREHVGKVVFINEDMDYYFGSFMAVIRSSEQCNSCYLFHVLASNIFQSYLNEVLNSSTINNLNSKVMENFQIPIPPLDLQREIAGVLDGFTQLSRELTKKLEQEQIQRRRQYEYYRDRLLDFGDKSVRGGVVEWKPLGEVAKYEQPTKYLVKSANYSNSFAIPVLTAGKTFILGYTDEIDNIYPASQNPVIIFDDFTTAHKWVDFDFKAKSSAMKMITSKDEDICLLKYIYYWLSTLPTVQNNGDHKRQ